jgi:IS605 OrfB family transposase
MEITIRGKIKDQNSYVVLDQMGEHLGSAKRSIFEEMTHSSRSLAEIKKEAQVKYEITARQFNSIRFDVQGIIKAQRELNSLHLKRIERRLKKKKEQLEETKNPFKRHHLKRKIKSLEIELKKYQDQLKEPSVCFGSKKLFQQQFHLEENGFQSHEEWKKAWKEARNSTFFIIGSKGESFGNQTCQFLPGKLQLRLTDQIAKNLGIETIQIPIEFTYRQDVIEQALALGQAIHYRFVKTEGVWYVHLTTQLVPAQRVTHRSYGALGIDLNPGCIAASHVGHDGNLMKSWQVETPLRGRRSEQIEETLGVEIKKLVKYAQENQIPIFIEELDFDKKKEELRSRGLNRMLSQFAYSKFYDFIKAQCVRSGVELKPINPAYTSIIGKNKFSEGYGLSTHMAAAFAIARRGLGFGEALRTKAKVRSSLPANRNRVRHVWSDWKALSRNTKRRKKSSLRRPRSERTRGDRRSSRSTACNGSPLHGLG